MTAFIHFVYQQLILFVDVAHASKFASKKPKVDFVWKKYPLSEPEHELHTRNSLLNDLCSQNGGKKTLESNCDYVNDVFTDNDLHEFSKNAGKVQPPVNEASSSSDKNSSQNSDLPDHQSNSQVRRSKRLCLKVSLLVFLGLIPDEVLIRDF